jgi:PAS domain S-box-containing protein
MRQKEITHKNNQGDNYSNELTPVSYYFSILIALGTIAALFLISIFNYLLFHSIVEGFSIVIACGIFMVVWNSRRFIENNFFIIIGIAYVFVSAIDFIHAVTYNGIDIFSGKSANLSTQLWIAARYLQAISLLIAPLLIDKKIKIYHIISIYFIALIFIFLSIFYLQIFPDCFIEGRGLTPFKKTSEFVIASLFFLSIIVLHKKKEYFNSHLFDLVVASNIVNIASELNFTFYETPYSLPNLTGHILKVISFYLIYKAIIVTGLKDPFNVLFRKLKQKEETLQLTRFSVDHAQGLFFWIKPDGKIYNFNNTVIQKLGYTSEKLYQMSFFEICRDSDLEIYMNLRDKTKQRKSFTIEHPLITQENKTLEMEIEFNYLEFESEEYYCTIARDITERKRTKEKLLESEARFRNLADTAPVMIWMTDSSKMCNYCNKPWLEFTGRTIENELGFGWTELIHPDDKTIYIEKFSAMFDVKKEFNIEYRFKRQDGQYRWILNTGIPRFTTNCSFLGYIGSCIDITELKRSREQSENSLKEKVVLLKEIHHRVKNNLQLITSLFNLQYAYIQDDEAKEMFMESQNRVKSMALIHEKLYLSNNLSYINFSEYMRGLITNLLSSYRFKLNTLDLELKIDDLEINVDLAVYLGLIINELISNSFKHAFPEGKGFDGSKSKLVIYLNNLESRKYAIIVKDNGCGFPDTLDFRNTNSLGMQLVNSLVDQIRGYIELKRKGGTEFILTFELKN